jgi:lysyl-tRNA synthetase class 2
MDWTPTASPLTLMLRAHLIRRIREYFWEHGYVEVETPIASREVVIDAHLSPWSAAPRSTFPNSDFWYLQTSPEAAMKRLVSAGMQRIFQIAHTFRADERGSRHHPEFLMLEWYAVGTDHNQQMSLVEDLVRTVFHEAQELANQYQVAGPRCPLPLVPFERMSYRAAFAQKFAIDIFDTNETQLADLARQLGLNIPQSGISGKDNWCNFLLAEVIEPQALTPYPIFLHSYPASQSALARIVDDGAGQMVAERFELYLEGVELCNGYHEQQDGGELRERMEEQNRLRVKEGQHPLPICQKLIDALNHHFPNCAGVALGIDRLIMLALGYQDLDDVVAFPPERA